jgi:molecular chaperone GrpE
VSGRFRVKIDGDNTKDSHKAGIEETAEEIAELTAEEAAQMGSADLVTAVREIEAEMDRMRAELDSAAKSMEEEHNRYLRALADFSNYKRRQQEETETRALMASQELILKLLPIIDNFERAIQAAGENRNFDGLVDGVSLTLRQLRDLLEKEGVQPIEAVGQEFDPNLHEAVMRIETEDLPDNTVVEEFQKGYTQGSRVIRPAQVKVATR